MNDIKQERSVRLLNLGISYIRDFGKKYVPYNLQFLGHSMTDEYIINGESTKHSVSTNEFCYGYDEYGELQIINVYKTEKGTRYASIERSMSVYVYWRVLET